jgi:hypothetical protein
LEIILMAQRVVTRLIDDMNGQEADETVTFSLDGEYFEIELTAGNAEKLRNALAPYMQAGRKLRRSGAAAPKPRRAVVHTPPSVNGKAAAPAAMVRIAEPPSPATVRAWAAANGVTVSDRGRISADVMAQFAAANP